MSSRQIAIRVLTVSVLVLICAQETQAQFGSLQRTFFRGSQFAGDPLFLSQPQNGPLQNFNQFTQRVEQNRAGGGFTYEFFRFFGPDSFGNVNTLDLGPIKLELGPDNTLGQSQRVGLHGKVGFTTRFIPELTFQSNTGQRTFNQFSGVTGFPLEPIKYRLTVNTGAQDFEYNGNILVNNDARINMLGFYDFKLQLTNVGNFKASGAGVQDEEVTDFDVGPINVSGNLFADGISGFFQSIGLAPAATTPRIFSAAAQKEKSVDDLMAQIDAGEGLTDQEAQFLINQMFLTAFRNDPIGFVTNGLPAEVPGFESLSLSFSAPDQTDPSAASPLQVPEPGTLILLIGVLILTSLTRRFAPFLGGRGI